MKKIPQPAVVLPALALCMLFIAAQGHERAAVRLEYCNRLNRWNDIIALCERLDRNDFGATVISDLNRALFHTGRLGDEMFRFPQPSQAVFSCMFPQEKPSFTHDIRLAQSYYDLGSVNHAQKALYEIFVNETGHPYVLNLLAEIHLVKGQVRAAEKLYNRLGRDLVLGPKARQALERLKTDPLSGGDERIRQKRFYNEDRDEGMYRIDLRETCLTLLEKNPHNRMAFEYLMMICLLSRDLGPFAAYMDRYGGLSAARLPRHWAEALAVYIDMAGPGSERLRGRVPSSFLEKLRVFKQISATVREQCLREGVDEKAFRKRAYDRLRPDFGDTYFFYFFFNESGAVRWPG